MKKINIYRIIDFLVLFAFAYFPDYILSGKLDTAYDIYSLIVFVTIAIFYLVKRKFSIPKIILLIGVMQLIPLIVTVTYGDHTMFKRAVRILFGSVSLAFYIEYNISFRKKEFLKSIIIFLGTLVIVNILSFFIYYPSLDPKQLNFYFLGNDNGSIYEALTFIYLTLIYFTMYKKKIPLYFYAILILVLAGYFYVKSGNGMMCMLITVLFVLFYKTSYAEKVLSQKALILFYILLFLMIVVLRNNSIILRIVLNILGKSPTISGRTYIWDKCYYYISMHPLLGNGYENELLAMSKFGNVKAHNVIIQYLYTGGIATLSLFLMITGLVLNKIKKSNINEDIKRIMNFSIFLFFIISIFDFYLIKFTTIMMFMIYYFIAIETSQENKKELTVRIKNMSIVKKSKEFLSKINSNKFYKGLFKNSFWAFAGDTSASIINLIVTIILIKLIGNANFGVLVLTQTYMQIIDVILNVQSWKSVIQYGQKSIVEKSKNKLLSYIKLGIRIDVLTAILGGLVAMFIAPLVGHIFGWSNEAILCARIFSITIFSHLSGTSTAVLRIFDKYHLVAAQKFSTALIKLISLGVLLIAFNKVSLVTATLVYCLTDIVGNILLVIIAFVIFKKKYKVKELINSKVTKDSREFLKFTLWSTFGDITDIPVNYLDMFIISLLGAEMVAVFKVFKQCISILKKVTSAIQQAIMPQFSELIASSQKQKGFDIVCKIRNVILKIMIPMGLLIGLTSPLWLKYLYGDIYANEWYILQVYLIIQIVAFSFTTIHPLYIVLNKVKKDAVIALVSNIVYFIVAFILVKYIGMFGIVIAFAIQSGIIIYIKYNDIKKELI